MTDKEKIAKTAKQIGKQAGAVAETVKDAVRDAMKDNKGDWSSGAKIGAAVGSAAIAAALIYAGRHQMKKHDDFSAAKPGPLPKYENEPDYDDQFDDGAGQDEEE